MQGTLFLIPVFFYLDKAVLLKEIYPLEQFPVASAHTVQFYPRHFFIYNTSKLEFFSRNAAILMIIMPTLQMHLAGQLETPHITSLRSSIWSIEQKMLVILSFSNIFFYIPGHFIVQWNLLAETGLFFNLWYGQKLILKYLYQYLQSYQVYNHWFLQLQGIRSVSSFKVLIFLRCLRDCGSRQTKRLPERSKIN